MVKDLSERLKTLHHGLENGLSYLIPHLGRLMETEPARRLVRIVLIAVHLAMAILLTYLLNSWLNIFLSATVSTIVSMLSYYLWGKVLL